MKKLLWIVVLGLLWCNTSNAGKWGEGELQLTKNVVDYFIQYIRGKGSKYPSDFYVTLDGTDATAWHCSHGPTNCLEGDAKEDIKHCERLTGKKCKKFAFKRTIRWKNGINPAKGKASKINSKWSDSEIYAKLTELGFYRNTTTTKKIEKKETKTTGDIFPTNAGKTTFKKKTMEDLVYLNNKKRNKEIKEHWNKKYPEYKGYKAWAESPNRAWAWRSSSISEKDAITQAVDRCNTYEADYNDPPLCVVTKVGDKHLTYQEQADWMQKIYGRTTLAAKLIGKKKIEKKKVEKKKKPKKKMNDDLVKQLKDLNELYESGVLTEEEFNKVKKKLLN